MLRDSSVCPLLPFVWAHGNPESEEPLSGPPAALPKRSAAGGGARTLRAQERACARARWRWPPPGSAERCGQGRRGGGRPPGAFRQRPAWMGAAARCCAARPRWILAGASEWEALSAAVLACLLSSGQRVPPGRGGGRRPPRSFSAAGPAGQPGAPRGLSPFGAILVNFKRCFRERLVEGKCCPRPWAGPAPTEPPPLRANGPGRVRLGGGNRAATCASRRGSPGCPGPICLSPQSAGCPASAARMWWGNGAVSRGGSPWPGRTRWGACAACSTPSTSSSGWVRASGDRGARHDPGGASASGATGTGEGKRPPECFWCAPLGRRGSSWHALKKSVWKLVLSEISVVLASCYKYTCGCVHP